MTSAASQRRGGDVRFFESISQVEGTRFQVGEGPRSRIKYAISLVVIIKGGSQIEILCWRIFDYGQWLVAGHELHIVSELGFGCILFYDRQRHHVHRAMVMD